MNDAEQDSGLPGTPGHRYAKRVADELFVAGQVPRDRSGTVVAVGDPAGQAVARLDNLATLLGVNRLGYPPQVVEIDARVLRPSRADGGGP